MTAVIALLFDGLAYGGLLFLIGVGLAVTLGLMNFVHLAHGVFAMAGGYLAVTLTRDVGWSFYAALPVVFIVIGAAGALMERLLYRHFLGSSKKTVERFSVFS